MARHLIVFVCTGNVCRSPMAEYLLRGRLDEGLDWRVASAGLSAVDGMPASRAAVTILAERHIDLGPHRSRSLGGDLVDAADLIVVMTASHRDQMRAMFPGSEGKVSLLKSFDPAAVNEDVLDPIGQPPDTYRMICREIAAALPGLVSYLKALQGVEARRRPRQARGTPKSRGRPGSTNEGGKLE